MKRSLTLALVSLASVALLAGCATTGSPDPNYTAQIDFVQAQTIRNKKSLEEKDPVRRQQNLDDLRRYAVARTLFKPTTLLRAIEKLGFVQADPIRGEAQDVSGKNNANMSTPADGGRPRMQMYLWTQTPQRDGTGDTHIIIHELSHGTSHRLIGNSTGY